MAKIRSHEAWQALFAEYEAGQESARDFCVRHGLRLQYFYRRSLELCGHSASRRGRDGQSAAPAAFVPVTVTPRGVPAPIGRAPTNRGLSTADTVTLTIGQVSMTLSSSVPPAWVAALLTALET